MKLAAIFAGALVLAALAVYGAYDWAFPSGTLRYRLTLEVEVDGKVQTGSGVIEVRYEIPPRWMLGANRVVPSVRGEAVAADLGPYGMVFALLRGVPVEETSGYVADAVAIPTSAFGLGGSVGAIEESTVRKLGSIVARAEIPFSALPMLVRFRDLNDPKSVERVYPDNLAATLGPHTRLRRVTIETTHDPVTTGIKTKLKWLEGLGGYLDGSRTHFRNDLSNTLTGADFIRWGF
jgi:hypothetical protein